jgi:hypothetical protein
VIDLEKLRKVLNDGLRLEPYCSLSGLLRYAYKNRELSIEAITKLAKGEASSRSIRRLLISYGVKMRPRGGKHHVKKSSVNTFTSNNT